MKNNIFKFLGLLLVGLIVVVLFKHYHLGIYLGVGGFNHYHEQILNFEKQHFVEFTFVYMCSYVVLIACCIPGTILLDLLAGFVYGPFWGTIWVVWSYLIGSIANFLLVRYFFHDIFHERFAHLRKALPHERGQFAMALNLVGLRLIPVLPFWILNIMAAILAVPLWLFSLTTFIGIIPTSIIYVLIGNGVRGQINHYQLSETILLQPKMWIPLLMLAILILVPNGIKIYRRRKNRSQHKTTAV